MGIRYYCNTPMYANLYANKDLDRRYEEQVMSLSVK